MNSDAPQVHWFRRVIDSWATRSLAVGAVATVFDIAVGSLLLFQLGASTRVAAMVGVVVGATFTFFANRYFAFKEHNPKLTGPAVRFVAVTLVSTLVHGQFVVWLRETVGVPFVAAKMVADVAVFSIGQLLLLRYLVFPKTKVPEAGAETAGQ